MIEPAFWLPPEGEAQTNADKAWIQTFSGGQFHILKPTVDEVNMSDIAHALAQQCRFTGHTKFHYSIAQHSVYVSHLVPKEFALWGLLHDASEAYVADLNRPAKHYTPIGPIYKQVEGNIMRVIAEAYGLEGEEPACVKEADRAMMWAELQQLLPNSEQAKAKWGTPTPAAINIEEMVPKMAERLFWIRFLQLTEETHGE